jgi:hypothetical protein
MVHCIGAVPGIVIIIIIICIMNNYRIVIIPSMIAVVVVIIIMAVNTNSHYSNSSPIRRWCRGRIIGYINRRIHILDHRC